MRKVFLDDLPRKGEKINWKDSEGFKVNFTYEDINGVIEIHKYIYGKHPKLILKYNGYIYEDKPISTDRFCYCQLGYYLNKRTNNFKLDVGQIVDSYSRDIIIINKEYRENIRIYNKEVTFENQKWYKYHCNKCGNEDWIIEGSLIKQSSGCNTCCNPPKKVKLGINTMWDKARWMCELGISEEDAKNNWHRSSDNIKVKCPTCGNEKVLTICNIFANRSIGCACGDGRSYLSKYITSVLDQLGTNYRTEAKYEWNKYVNPKNNKLTQASIDFVINYNTREIPLEADGEFHRKDNHLSGQTKEMSEYIDRQRDGNCLKYLGEETIRISDEGDIKENVLNSKLNELFDLSDIDWLKCEEYAIKSNRVKEICEQWKLSNEGTVSKFIEKHNINNSEPTIRKYLRQGARLGWCNYEDVKKTRRVIVKREGVVVGIFDSCNSIEINSVDLFGDKLYRGRISEVCSGKIKSYKGFTFEYIDENYEEVA